MRVDGDAARTIRMTAAVRPGRTVVALGKAAAERSPKAVPLSSRWKLCARLQAAGVSPVD